MGSCVRSGALKRRALSALAANPGERRRRYRENRGGREEAKVDVLEWLKLPPFGGPPKTSDSSATESSLAAGSPLRASKHPHVSPSPEGRARLWAWPPRYHSNPKGPSMPPGRRVWGLQRPKKTPSVGCESSVTQRTATRPGMSRTNMFFVFIGKVLNHVFAGCLDKETHQHQRGRKNLQPS